MLTKRELIEKLMKLSVPDDTPIVTEGFDECNYDFIEDPYLIELKLDVDRQSSHCGDHVDKWDHVWKTSDIPPTTCIVVSFTVSDDDDL